MDQIKIGKFIAERRKQVNLTQAQLAERLNVTDRAVSKWETGKSMPDSSIMITLCEILKINVNDLLNGEVVIMESYNEKTEKALLKMVQQKQFADKLLLTAEIVMGIFFTAFFLAMVLLASYLQVENWLRIVMIVGGLIPFVVAMGFAIRIEQMAGYYKCTKCGHKYVPKYSSVLWAMHFGRTRFMKCPKCSKWSWNKKVINKD